MCKKLTPFNPLTQVTTLSTFVINVMILLAFHMIISHADGKIAQN